MSARHHAPLYAPLRLAPGRSRCLLVYALSLHSLALVAIFASRMPVAAAVALGLLVGASLAGFLSRHLSSPSGQILVAAVWLADDDWQLEFRDGRRRPPLDWDAPLVHPRLVMLRFWQDRFRFRCLCLCPDAIDVELLRRLRVRLRRHEVSGQGGAEWR